MADKVDNWRTGGLDQEERDAVLLLFGSSRAELDKIPFEPVFWRCKVKLCKCKTKMRDYSVRPYFYHPAFGWIDQVINLFLCGKHNKAFKERWGKDLARTPLRKGWGWDETVKPEIIY